MRLSVLVLMGASSLALTGCSFLGGLFGVDKHHKTASHHDGGTYYGHSDCGASNCVGGREISKWNVEGAIGPAFIAGGDAITSGGLNPENPTAVRSMSMDEVYEEGYRAELGLSYMLNPNRKLTAMVTHQEHNGANDTQIADIAGQALTGSFSDYKATGVEIGLRQYATPRYIGQSNLQYRPYVEGRIGAAQLDDIEIENAQLGGVAYNNGTIPFYEGGTVGTAAGLVGFEAPVFDRMTLGLETGVRYMSKPSSDDAFLAGGNPIAGANNGGDTWTVPVTIRGRYRF